MTQQMVDEIGAKEYENEAAKDKAKRQAHEYCVEVEAGEVRRLISEDKVRPDGRGLDELRPLNSQVDLLPRVHVKKALVIWGEDEEARKLDLGDKKHYWYGLEENDDIQAVNVDERQDGMDFDVLFEGKKYAHFSTPLVGHHLLLNSLAVIGVAMCSLFSEGLWYNNSEV